jgi:hypothetical protein
MPSFYIGTRILTERGRVKVENLRIGDNVLAWPNVPMPIRWIGRKMYRAPFTKTNPGIVPVLIKAGAIDKGRPSRDLRVSPLHCIHVSGVLVPANKLVNGVTILRCENLDEVSYFHIELSRSALLVAEDAFAESYVDRGNRGMFLNAEESAEAARRQELTPSWSSCAPLVEQGPELERIREHLALRAGIIPAEIMERPQQGPLIGYLEWADHVTVSGWAWLPEFPDTPVVLEIRDGAETIGRVIANLPREDLRKAGIGSSRHGFHLQLARSLDPSRLHSLSVVRAEDATHLPGSPRTLRAQPTLQRLQEFDLERLAVDSSDVEIVEMLSWLKQQQAKLSEILGASNASSSWLDLEVANALASRSVTRGAPVASSAATASSTRVTRVKAS